MHVGASQERLERKNMPLHEEVKIFSKQIVQMLDDYEIVSEHEPSRVIMLAKKKYKRPEKADGRTTDGQTTDKQTTDEQTTDRQKKEWWTWIDFEKFRQLTKQTTDGQTTDFTVDEYLAKTPTENILIDETTDELEFWEEEFDIENFHCGPGMCGNCQFKDIH